MSYYSKPLPRHKTKKVNLDNIVIGGGSPIIVQSMTNTDTADINATTKQIVDLYRAGSQIVRITVDREDAARSVPYIIENLQKKNIDVPIIGDFHYNGHKLLTQFPSCAQALAKYRINPGNVGFGQKKDMQFAQIIEQAIKYNKVIRIGVNWGSLDQSLLTHLMNQNKKLNAKEVLYEAMIQSTLISANLAVKLGLPSNKIILSAKVSQLQGLVEVYTKLASRCDYALHLGLTEAGMGSKGIVASSAALAILLQQGIGDTIRISLTPEPNGDRCKEVIVAQELLQVMGFRNFIPVVSACPGCGRTTSSFFQELAKEIQNEIQDNIAQWREQYIGIEDLKIAVMGCIVNGPGESKHADIGISLPGTGETPIAPVFIEGKKVATLRGPNIAQEFKKMIQNYINDRFKHQ